LVPHKDVFADTSIPVSIAVGSMGFSDG